MTGSGIAAAALGWVPGATGLPAGVFLYAVAVVFLAAVVRGYSGFGLSALVVLGLSLVVEPTAVVPVVLLLEVAASVHLIRSVRGDIDWPLMGWLAAAAAPAMPFGTWLLTSIPAGQMRAATSAAVLVLALAIWKVPGARFAANGRTMAPAGLVSGILNGAAAIGGLPLVLYFLGTGTAPARARAMIIVYLLFAGVYASGVAAMQGLVSGQTLVLAVLLAVPVYAGNAIGNRRYLRTTPDSFRRFALVLLVGLSLAGLLRAIA